MGLPETDFFGLVQPEKKTGNGVHSMFVRDLSFSKFCLQENLYHKNSLEPSMCH